MRLLPNANEYTHGKMAWGARSGWKQPLPEREVGGRLRLTGQRSPVGMETLQSFHLACTGNPANWPRKPGRDGNTTRRSWQLTWQQGYLAWGARSRSKKGKR